MSGSDLALLAVAALWGTSFTVTSALLVGVILILVAGVFPANNGLFLPTTYTVVTAIAVFSGIHYIFHVAKLMREEEQVGRQ